MTNFLAFFNASGLRARIAALAVGVLVVFFASDAAFAQCLDARAVNAAVASGEVKPLRSISGSLGGEVVRASLCRQGGRLVYILSVLSNGRVSERIVDARTGAVLR